MGWLFGKKKMMASALGPMLGKMHMEAYSYDRYNEMCEKSGNADSKENKDFYKEWLILHTFAVTRAISVRIDSKELTGKLLDTLHNYVYSQLPVNNLKADASFEGLIQQRYGQYGDIFDVSDGESIGINLTKFLGEEVLSTDNMLCMMWPLEFLQHMNGYSDMLAGIVKDNEITAD